MEHAVNFKVTKVCIFIKVLYCRRDCSSLFRSKSQERSMGDILRLTTITTKNSTILRFLDNVPYNLMQ